MSASGIKEGRSRGASVRVWAALALGWCFAPGLWGGAAGSAVGVSPASQSVGVDAAAVPFALPNPSSIRFGGFVQDWSTVGEDATTHAYDNAGNFVKHARLALSATPADGVSVALLTEMAGNSVTTTPTLFGATLLDAYVKVDLAKFLPGGGPPLALTAGQFKTPFGLNRMYSPEQLQLVDYSIIYGSPYGVMGTSTYWDDGLKLSYRPNANWQADAAWVEGLGINQAFPGGNPFGLEPDQDFVANIAFTPGPHWKLGASYYYGEAFTASGVVAFPNKPKSWVDGYARYAAGGKSFAAELEFLNRSGSGNVDPQTPDRGGLTAQITQYLWAPLQLVAGYDHVTVYGPGPGATTRYVGGLNVYPGGTVRVSLQQMAFGFGISQQPVSSRTIVQTQVIF